MKFFMKKGVMQKITIIIILIVMLPIMLLSQPSTVLAAPETETAAQDGAADGGTTAQDGATGGDTTTQDGTTDGDNSGDSSNPISDTVDAAKQTISGMTNWVGTLTREFIQFLASLGDIVMGLFQWSMYGLDFLSVTLSTNDTNFDTEGSWLHVKPDEEVDYTIPEGVMDGTGLFGNGDLAIPNMLYSPEAIFTNSVPALDINFLKPNTYQPASVGGEQRESGAAKLQEQIGIWYRTFRNLAITILLIILVYIGIRILISSTAGEKAKYQEGLKDWVVALCLVFFIHLLMSGILMLTEKFTQLFENSIGTNDIVVSVPKDSVPSIGEDLKFKTNLIGYARFRVQATRIEETGAFTFIYFALIGVTVSFTFLYFKRFIWVAFLTMIAPLVAITYPLDKMGDSKAQAFNKWLTEYIMQVIIQPVHLLLYSALIGSALDLVETNFLYAIIVLLCIQPAEKFIRALFGLNSQTTEDFGSFASGAIATQALNMLTKNRGGGKSLGGKDNNNNNSNTEEDEGLPDGRTFDDTSLLSNDGEGLLTDGINDERESTSTYSDNSESGNQPNFMNTAEDLGEGRYLNSFKDENDMNQAVFHDELGNVIPYNELTDEEKLRLNGELGTDGALRYGYGEDRFNNKYGDEIDRLNSPEEEGLEDSQGDLPPEVIQQRIDTGNIPNSQGENLDNQNNRTNYLTARGRYWANEGKDRFIKGVKKYGKKSFKLVSLGALGLAGGLIGGALATGFGKSPGDAISTAIAGAGSGAYLGYNTPDKLSGTYDWAKDKGKSLRLNKIQKDYEKNKYRYGIEAADAMKQEALDNERYQAFKKNNKQKERAERIYGKLKAKGKNISKDQILQSMFDYSKYGINANNVDRLVTLEGEQTGKLGNDVNNTRLHNELIKSGLLESQYSNEYMTGKGKDDVYKSLKGQYNDDRTARNVVNGIMYLKGLQDFPGDGHASGGTLHPQGGSNTQRTNVPMPETTQSPSVHTATDTADRDAVQTREENQGTTPDPYSSEQRAERARLSQKVSAEETQTSKKMMDAVKSGKGLEGAKEVQKAKEEQKAREAQEAKDIKKIKKLQRAERRRRYTERKSDLQKLQKKKGLTSSKDALENNKRFFNNKDSENNN